MEETSSSREIGDEAEQLGERERGIERCDDIMVWGSV
jgi:hypothetical protein